MIILKTTLMRYLLDWKIPVEVELVVIIFEEEVLVVAVVTEVVVVVVQASEKDEFEFLALI